MNDDQFTQLFKYMTERFDRLETQVESKVDKTSFDRVYNKLDEIADMLQTQEVEQVAMQSQLAQHEQWHHEIADHVNLALNREG